MKGSIFDIRRFSTHDGVGIRTTVFLKGCPLKCVWCQNPEGISTYPMPVYFESKCIHCGTCVRIAKKGGVCEKEGRIHIDREKMEDWNNLSDACPSGAIAMDSKIYEAEQLVGELLKDEVFFRRGGGVTLSGGEPLAQFEFSMEVLQKLHERGIHTAIETAMGVSARHIEELLVLPYLDQIYADMKVADEQEHKRYTGISNILIKKNLEHILSSSYKDKVIIRTPLIPEYTATEKNLSEIASFLTGIYPEVKYELLNYNPLAEAKYHLVNRKYCFEKNPKLYTKTQMEEFGEIVKKHGIKNLIMEI